jgi:hypothetical protein
MKISLHGTEQDLRVQVTVNATRRLNLRCRPMFVSFAVSLVRVTDYHSLRGADFHAQWPSEGFKSVLYSLTTTPQNQVQRADDRPPSPGQPRSKSPSLSEQEKRR